MDMKEVIAMRLYAGFMIGGAVLGYSLFGKKGVLPGAAVGVGLLYWSTKSASESLKGVLHPMSYDPVQLAKEHAAMRAAGIDPYPIRD